MARPSEKVVFCQVDAHLDTNPKIRRGGRDARELFLFLLRRVAMLRTNGEVPLKYIEPWYLADQLMCSEDNVRHGTSQAVTVRLIEIDSSQGVVRIVGWSEEWGRRPKSGAERTQKWRANQLEGDGAVTGNRHASSHVTVGDESDAGEERRGEENRVERSDSPGLADLKAKVDAAGGETGRKRNQKARKQAAFPLPSEWAPKEHERQLAREFGQNCDEEAADFRNHHKAKGSLFVDWDAAFNKWLRNSKRYADERRGLLPFAKQPQPRKIQDLD